MRPPAEVSADEVWRRVTLPPPIASRERDPLHPVYRVARRQHAGDPRLRIVDIELSGYVKCVA